jgi:hypothetical protein
MSSSQGIQKGSSDYMTKINTQKLISGVNEGVVEKARNGDLAAIMIVGTEVLDGYPIPVSKEEAFHLVEAAADKGYIPAKYLFLHLACKLFGKETQKHPINISVSDLDSHVPSHYLKEALQRYQVLENSLHVKDLTIDGLNSKVGKSKSLARQAISEAQRNQKEIATLTHQLDTISKEKIACESQVQTLISSPIHQELVRLKAILEEKSLELEIKEDDHSKAVAESLSHASDLERHNAYLANLLRRNRISFNPVCGHGSNNEEVAA